MYKDIVFRVLVVGGFPSQHSLVRFWIEHLEVLQEKCQLTTAHQPAANPDAVVAVYLLPQAPTSVHIGAVPKEPRAQSLEHGGSGNALNIEFPADIGDRNVFS